MLQFKYLLLSPPLLDTSWSQQLTPLSPPSPTLSTVSGSEAYILTLPTPVFPSSFQPATQPLPYPAHGCSSAGLSDKWKLSRSEVCPGCCVRVTCWLCRITDELLQIYIQQESGGQGKSKDDRKKRQRKYCGCGWKRRFHSCIMLFVCVSFR